MTHCIYTIFITVPFQVRTITDKNNSLQSGSVFYERAKLTGELNQHRVIFTKDGRITRICCIQEQAWSQSKLTSKGKNFKQLNWTFKFQHQHFAAKLRGRINTVKKFTVSWKLCDKELFFSHVCLMNICGEVMCIGLLSLMSNIRIYVQQ